MESGSCVWVPRNGLKELRGWLEADAGPCCIRPGNQQLALNIAKCCTGFRPCFLNTVGSVIMGLGLLCLILGSLDLNVALMIFSGGLILVSGVPFMVIGTGNKREKKFRLVSMIFLNRGEPTPDRRTSLSQNFESKTITSKTCGWDRASGLSK
jgi:hypothetical protein